MNRKEAAIYALEAAKKAGADMVSVTVSDGCIGEYEAEGGEFSMYRTLYNASLALKTVKDGKAGTSMSSSEFDKAAIDKVVADCIAASEVATPDEGNGIAEKIENKSFEQGVLTPDRDAWFGVVEEFLDETKAKYPKINIRNLHSKHIRKGTLYMNSNGVEFETLSGHYDFRTMVMAKDQGKGTSFNGAGASFTDLNQKLMDMGQTRAVIERQIMSLDPKPVQGKFVGPIVLTPACLMSILFTMAGLFVGENNIVDGTSIWKDKLGQAVAHPSFTFSLNPHDARIVSGERFTSDGYESADMDIIKDGVLKNFMLSLYGSKKTKLPRAVNLSQAGIVLPGDKSIDEIIAGIDNGLLVGRFSGGNPVKSGDFSGVAKNSFAIKNGQIDHAVNETMISGNLESLFNSIIAISKEVICNGSSVLPYVAFDGVTISGV